tara:strand:+ start:14480 stop:15241 length:762 start_codon:yes stop_codon:yes gene_type:complete
MKAIKATYVSLVFAFLYLPLLVLAIFSFNNARYAMTWHGFTTHWYHVLFNDSLLLRSAGHSLLLAFLAACIATAIASVVATALLQYRFKGKRIIHNLIIVLIVMPDLVIGIVLLILFSSLHLPLGFTSLLLAHITICLPFAVLTIYSRATDLDSNLFESARDLGASDTTIYLKILLPLLKPALLSAWLLAFAISLDDIIVSFFVSGPSFSIMPLQIYSMTKVGITPEINALCTLMLGLIFMIVGASQLVRKAK